MLVKNIFRSSLLAVTMLAGVGTAFAGVYAPSSNYAPEQQAAHHFYVSAQGGFMWQYVQDKTYSVVGPFGHEYNAKYSLDKNLGFAGRLALGYDFNPNFGIELGGLYFSPTKTAITVAGQTDQVLDVKNYGADLLLVGNIPLNQKLYLIVKGGAAYLHTNFTIPDTSASASANRVRPEGAVGLGIHINPNADFTVTYDQIFGTGNIVDKFTPSIGSAYVGFNYYFA